MSGQLVWPNVTPAQFAALKAAAGAAGLQLKGYSGEVQAHGCIVAYAWDGWAGCNSARLTLRLVKNPPLCGGIALGKLHELVEQVLAGPPRQK